MHLSKTRFRATPGIEHSLYAISQILSLTLFEKMALLQAFSQLTGASELGQSRNQLNRFNI